MVIAMGCLALTAPGCEQAPEQPISSRGLAERFPAVAEMLATAEGTLWIAQDDGYRTVLGPDRAEAPIGHFRSLARALTATVPATADGELRLTTETGVEIAIQRRSAGPDACELEDGAVICSASQPGLDIVVLALGPVLEELWVLQQPMVSLGYDVALPPGWTLHEVNSVDGNSSGAELRDERGTAQLRVAVPGAWDGTGEPVDVALVADADGVALTVGAPQTWPILIDPSWVDAGVPMKLRGQHTATLLLDGRVLYAGGGTTEGVDGTTELYDPRSGTSTAAASMLEARRDHTATLLPDGRVLIAGGYELVNPLTSTELFDPDTGTFTAGPALAQAHGGHAATRLPSGQVLIVGGGTVNAELFDPTTDTFATTGAMVAPMAARLAAALLFDGRVLILGSDVGTTTALAQLFDPAANGGTGAFTTTAAPTGFVPQTHSLTLLRDGRVLALGGCPCVTMGGPIDSSEAAALYDPTGNSGAGTFLPTGFTVRDRLDHSATLLPSGEVLIAGSVDEAPSPEQSTVEIFNPDANSGLGAFTELPQPMPAPHGAHTATLLPTGDVLIFGGDQATAELFVGGGSGELGAFTSAGSMATPRQMHSVTALADGRVLMAGGEGSIFFDLSSAEIYDPDTETYSATGSLATGRRLHSATLLNDDRVLVAGGQLIVLPTATAELFDPSANSGAGAFTTTSAMTTSRTLHTATVLPGGEILMAGGTGTSGLLASAERYDPAAGTFTATAGTMTVPRSAHGAALLPSGKVLLVSINSAELYDPVTDTFTATANPGAAYPQASVVVLSNGKALVTGSSTLAAELYDPDTETFSYAGADWVPRLVHQAVALPTGGVLLVGGQSYGAEPDVHSDAALFEPLSSTFVPTPLMAVPRTLAGAALLPSGEVFVAGGVDALFIGFPTTHASAERWSPTVGDLAWRPTITSAPATATPGDEVVIQASGLSGPEASSGRSNASASNHPVAIWQSRLGGGVLFGTLVSWTSSSVTWRVPPTAAYGPGRLTLVVNGIASDSWPIAIEAAPQGGACRYDAQCTTGHCADGVCCDQACDDSCEACLAVLKGAGDDGVCGEVPPELDPNDDCVLPRGTPCTADEQCETELCVDDVCCETTCPGQCEACDVKDSVGLCVPVVGAPHGERPPCDATPPDDPCDLTSCDGVGRSQCDGTVGPCGAYACTPDGCLDQCGDDDDCAPGHHCQDGICEAGQCDGTVATTPDGTEVDCAPYRCRSDGSCLNSCSNVDDCGEPFACSPDGRCVPRPPVDDAGAGCGCRMAGARKSMTGPVALLLAIALGAGLRRRTSRSRRCSRRRRSPWRWVAAALGSSILLCWLPAWSQPAPSPPAAEPGETEPAKPRATADPEASPGPTEPAETDPGVDSATTPKSPTDDETAPPDGLTLQERKQGARSHFERGLALGSEGAWSAALAEFKASRALYPTRVATKNAALSYRKLERFDEALETYESLLREFENLSTTERDQFAKQIIDLRALVGTIEIDGAKSGATILIDGRARAIYPATDPLRVPAGTHIVRVHLEGYEPFETQLEVAGRSSVLVQAPLTPLHTSGTLKITETAGQALDVVVDSVVVGQTPWEGRVSVGQHVVRLQGADQLGTTPVPAPVRSNETTTLRLQAKPLNASLRVAPTPASAEVTIDSVSVGRGVWEGRLPSGKHRVEITEEGFIKAVEDVSLKPKSSEDLKVRLERDDDAEIWQLPSKITVEVTGAVALAPTFGGDVTASCTDGCSQGPGVGVLAFLHAGYELGSGFGFGLSAGYLQASQEIEGRATPIQPVGLAPRQGSTSDSLRLRGLAVGGSGSLVIGEDYPLLFRLGVGPLFATLEDRRVGSFPVDGLTYQAGPVTQEPSAMYLFIDPEVRLSLPVGDHLQLGASLQALILVGLSQPKWDETQQINAADDGIGLYGGETLTGRVLVFIAPGISARTHF